ncbi:hypothetical protein [Phenylobacterium kunshanense]|nr:hypothetical protein [Phenylobacterium kunshanense]
MLEKARTVATRMRALKRDFAGAHRLAHDAQVREALARNELGLALHAALTAQADVQAKLRRQALAAFQTRGEAPLRRRNRISRRIDRMLMRLGSLGQALVIARSGVWRGSGQAAHDLRHMAAYARRGARADVTPLAPFDQAWYLAAHPDVASARQAPLVHYLAVGHAEGRSPSPLFDEAWYRQQNASDIAATGLSGLEHYLRVGAVRGASPHPLFDVGYYLAQAPVLAAGDDPLSHYLREGGHLWLSPHPAFDPDFYGTRAGDLSGRPALLHYLDEGWRRGLSPHPLVDPAWYRQQYPEVAEADIEPLTHFLAFGGFEGRDPSPWFSTAHYRDARGEALPPGVNPLTDYLLGGAWAVAEARPGFPTVAYLAARPDAARSGVTPLEHWARRQGR